MAGDKIQVKGGRIENPRRIDIQQLSNMGKTDLENQCIYLMKKRIALEDAIADLEKKNRGLHNVVKNCDRMLEQRTTQISTHQTITNRTLERVNREKDEYLQEIERLRGVVREMNNSVRVG